MVCISLLLIKLLMGEPATGFAPTGRRRLPVHDHSTSKAPISSTSVVVQHPIAKQNLIPVMSIKGASPPLEMILKAAADADAQELPKDDDDEEQNVPPGQMRVSEIKAELELRGISYADCFDKESMVQRLEEARASGRADPDILDKFNRQRLENQYSERKVDVSDEDLQQAVANDGTLPGGLTPDQFQKMTSNPAIMELLQSTKMQEAMKLLMTEGREELERKVTDDPELREVVEKLDGIMKAM